MERQLGKNMENETETRIMHELYGDAPPPRPRERQPPALKGMSGAIGVERSKSSSI